MNPRGGNLPGTEARIPSFVARPAATRRSWRAREDSARQPAVVIRRRAHGTLPAVRPLPACLVEEAARLFHDVRVEEVDATAHAAFIISRVLDRGTMRSVRALVELYGESGIHEFFLAGGGLRVSRPTLALWAARLGLSEDECTRTSSPRIRSPYWKG